MIIKPLTVIMSNYNGGNRLKYCIESILNQTFKNFNFYIIDDSSSDNSLNILRFYAKKDKRIKFFISKKKEGLPKNLNKLIKKTKTKFIARMDSDDISKSNRLEIQMNQIREENLDILGSNCIYLLNNKKLKNNSYFPVETTEIYNQLKRSNPLIHSSIIFKKKSIRKIGFYDEKLFKCQDLDLWLRAKKKKLKIKNNKRKLIIHEIKNYKSFSIIYYIFKVIKKNLFKSISFFDGLIFIIYNIFSLTKFNLVQLCKK